MTSYAPALAALEKIRPAQEVSEFEKLSILMVRAGNRAAAWNPKTDLYEAQRQADEEFLTSGVPSLLSKIVALQTLSEKHARGFDAIAWRAAHSIGLTPDLMRAAGYDHGTTGGQAGRLIKALLEMLRSQLEMERRTETRRVKGKTSGGTHRHVFGPLNFPKKVDCARMPDARITGLQFELEFYLRRYSAAKNTREIRVYDKLPNCGRPHHDVISEFVSCAAEDFPAPERRAWADRSVKGVDAGEAFAKAMRSNGGSAGKSVLWWGWGAAEGNAPKDTVISYWDTDADD
jgi:hypothetical protein